MAKRAADHQLIKDGTMSDEDGFSVGSQIGGPQRATAAQMAQRRLAKPRGGRRPGALRPPASPSPGMPSQQNLNSFGEGDRISMNGTQQEQQGGFSFGQQPNGYQPSQNSSSFPPYPNNSFNPSFAAPTSGFNFNAGQAQEVNNPFTAMNSHNAPPPEQTGFQGSIFNLPPQKMSPFQKFLEGEQKPQFAPGAPDISPSKQSQPSSNLFSQSINQQQPSQATTGMFGQPNAPQQPSNTAFGLSAVGNPPNQSPSNPFAQSIAQFQQSQSAKPTSNLFAHLGQPQPSSSFLAQGSTSPTQGESSMMQISPDPSPQSRPFGFLNQPNTQTQSSPTKGSTAQGGGGSLFDRISKPSETTSQSQPSPTKDSVGQDNGGSLFDRISKPTETNFQPQQTPTKDTTAQGSGGSLFDRTLKPSTETNDQESFNRSKDSSATNSTSPFSMPQPPGTSQVSNENGVSSPTKVSERKIAKPTLFQAPSEEARPSYKAIFGNLKMPPTSQSSPSIVTSGVSAIPQSSPSQTKSDSVLLTPENSVIPSSSMLAQQSSENTTSIHHKFGPPPPPEGYSEEEVRKWSLNWWILFYVRHKEKRIRNAERQCDERIKAVQNEFDPLAQIAGNKRKSSGLNQSLSNQDTQVQQVTSKNNKRSADEEPEKETAQGIADNGKKARGHDAFLYPSLPGASPGSQTSSIFKNILDKKEEAKINGTESNKATPLFQFPAPSRSSSDQSPTFQPSSNTFAPLPSKPNTGSPPQSSIGSSIPVSSPSVFANHQSTSNGALASTLMPSFKPTASAAVSSTASNPSFSVKPPTSSEAPSDATKALAVQFSSGATTSTESSFTPFSANLTTSSQTSSEEPKASAFKVPTFGAAGLSNASNTSPFSIKPSTSDQTMSEAPKAPVFKVPSFGAGASTANFMSQFGKAAEKTAAEEKKKRKAQDYDSDEEELEVWERRDAAEQAKKKQKLEEEIKGKAAKLVDGKWVIAADNVESGATAKRTHPADPNVSVLSQPRSMLTNGHNIFGHLSGEESGAEGSKTGDADDEDDEDEKDDETIEQRQVRGPFDYDESESDPDNEKATQATEPKALNNPFGVVGNGSNKSPSPFDHDAAEEASGESTGRSLFDRISKDKDGNPVREIPQASSQPVSNTSNVFGQSFNSSSSSNLFSQPSDAVSSFTSATSKVGDSPKGDHTWKADSPIKFSSSSTPPAVNVTSPSPSKPTFGGLFGAPKPNVATETPTKATSSIFSTPSAKTPNVGFSFGLKPTTASLAPPLNNGSNTTSRATSPGATTGESANESNADGEDDKAEKQEQIDLTSRGPGEENDDVILQVKARALKWDTVTSTWASKGVGPLRVLKNRESGLTRVLVRQDPSGKIVCNFALSKSFTYESAQSKIVRIPVLSESGKIETWMIKVGSDDNAKKLASALEENKA